MIDSYILTPKILKIYLLLPTVTSCGFRVAQKIFDFLTRNPQPGTEHFYYSLLSLHQGLYLLNFFLIGQGFKGRQGLQGSVVGQGLFPHLLP